jgi:SAM-dependent methyltransferase
VTADLKQQTTDTYNNSAIELAKYFRGIGSRAKDIDKAFELAHNPKNAKVLEIGCGDGRDAKEIVKRTSDYAGFDISKELVKLAKNLVPNARFEIADAASFNYPPNLNIVFAFASLLHLDKQELKSVLDKVHQALKIGGIFYISLKKAPQYERKIKEDKYGTRLFYFYNIDIMKALSAGKYEVTHTQEETREDTDWFEIALKKI